METTHLTREKQAIISAALPLVPFEGWTEAMLKHAAEKAGYDAFMVTRCFPEGAIDALDFHTAEADERMSEALEKGYSMETMRIRDRIATAVMVRLEQHVEHREAIRRGLAHYALPQYSIQGMQSLYRTVDAMWRAAGDTSTDWNFYTKRLLLSKVYMSTLLFWLNDESAGFEDTKAFLHRRIENVMQIEKAKGKLKSWWAEFSGKLNKSEGEAA